MFNPPNPNPGSFDDLLKRITRRMQQDKVDDQILGILQRAVEKEFGQENIMLSRPERKRLFQQITKAILADVLGKIDGTK